MPRIPITSLSQLLEGKVDHLAFRPSFESRSLSAFSAIARTAKCPVHLFVSAKRSHLAEENLKLAREAVPEAKLIQLDVSSPIQVADAMRGFVEGIADADGKVIIDISTFRREELLILLRMIAYFCQPSFDCKFIYVEAKQMAKGWLSRKTTAFRSVIGYPGEISPSLGVHLIVMLGFETQRARDIIDNYEPSTLSIGLGRKAESISPELHDRNVELYNEMKSIYGDNFFGFDFSLLDPVQTMHDLKSFIDIGPIANVVIAPLNNKLSTIGAGVLAMNNPRVQICYGSVLEYNEAEYSIAGSHAHIISLKDLKLKLGE